MSDERQFEAGSFCGHIDELLSHLSHDGVVGAGLPDPLPPRELRPKSWARCPAYHNEALFERVRDQAG